MNNNFIPETSTIWSFPERGSWSVHKGDYRGNWSPYIPKNIILRYSDKNDLILDQFVGSGTTLIEAKLSDRNAIGCDVNDNALLISQERINHVPGNSKICLLKRDARNLYDLKNNSIDLICTHPPYANIIKYSKDNKNDLSLMETDNFLIAMKDVSKECIRVLKNGKYCTLLMGDTRKNGYIIPLGFKIMNIFIESGFKLKEIIIKEQHNCQTTKFWRNICIKNNFYFIAHEYLFIFKKLL